MNSDTFAKLVAEEVKNKVSNESRKELLRKENWERWERSLIALVDNLESQIHRIDEDTEADTVRYSAIEGGEKLLEEALASYEARKKKVERFRFHVENRLAQVSKMIATGVPMEEDQSKTVALLTSAIQMHKSMMSKFDIEPTKIDQALWSALEGKWNFNNIKEEDFSE